MPAKDLERGSTPLLIPSQKAKRPMLGNIQYAEQHDKGFPAEVEGLPGFSSASSSCIDECSPGELIRGWSRGPDAGITVTRRIIDTGSVSDMAGVDDLDPLGLVKPYIVSSGTGMVSKEYCGTFRSHVAACSQKPGDHKPLLIRKGCNSQQCPECWQPWGKKRSASMEDSLNGYMNLKFGWVQNHRKGFSVNHMYPRHASFHPPQDLLKSLILATLDELGDLDEYPMGTFDRVFWSKFGPIARGMALDAGITAGIVVSHDFRLADEDDDETRRGEGRYVARYRAIMDRPDWQEHIKFYPHIHVIGWGRLENAAAFHERTGWTYRMHGVARSPAGLAYALLSHAVCIPGSKAYVPIGEMHSSKMACVTEYRYSEPILCSECLEEGRPETESRRVIAALLPTEDGGYALRCEHDGDLGERLRRRGRGSPVSWSFAKISNFTYRRVRRRRVFAWRQDLARPADPGGGIEPDGLVRPGERKRRLSIHQVKLGARPIPISKEKFEEGVRGGTIPGSWFEDSDGGDEHGKK
jgi:hypothetical protein